MVRIKDIAERAGVSTTTVSNVIHRKEGKVSPALAARIKEMVQEMGYVPSLSARMLAKENSRVIGVVIQGVSETPLGTQRDLQAASLVYYLEREIRNSGYYMMLFFGRSLEEILQESQAWNFDGVILYGADSATVKRLRASFEKPVITLDAGIGAKEEGLCRICSDDYGGGRLIGQYLLRRGHQKLLFAAENGNAEAEARWLGFRQAMEEAGLPDADEMRLLLPEKQEERLTAYERLLPLLRQQTALCFGSDALAVESLIRLRELGLRVPEELSVTGFGDTAYARNAQPGLTTVHQSMDEMARMAVETLIAMASGGEGENCDRLVPTYVTQRDSVMAR